MITELNISSTSGPICLLRTSHGETELPQISAGCASPCIAMETCYKYKLGILWLYKFKKKDIGNAVPSREFHQNSRSVPLSGCFLTSLEGIEVIEKGHLYITSGSYGENDAQVDFWGLYPCFGPTHLWKKNHMNLSVCVYDRTKVFGWFFWGFGIATDRFVNSVPISTARSSAKATSQFDQKWQALGPRRADGESYAVLRTWSECAHPLVN